ncbi:MAG: hypothetical protein QWI36_04510 [Wolbachia endosymbiont of Tyrophagus putrescentiae]|nr:hypothetical protein [Wolbachia endosymbiont of Tyrophagus putrescentiae]
MSELKKVNESQVTKWEVVRNSEYANNCLSRIMTLYVIKLTQLPSLYKESKPEVSTILVRLDVASENIFLNRAIVIEIMTGIFPYKFSSKKRNNISRLEDLYNHLCSIINSDLPKEILESLIKEYKNSVSLLRTIT